MGLVGFLLVFGGFVWVWFWESDGFMMFFEALKGKKTPKNLEFGPMIWTPFGCWASVSCQRL